MANGTIPRLLGAVCFFVGGVTVVGGVVLWPIGYVLFKVAAEKEEERKAELEAIGAAQ